MATKKTPSKKKPVARNDGWINLLTGLGMQGKDKRVSNAVEWNPIGEIDAEELYSQDDMAARIVDHVPNEGTREWIEFKKIDADTVMSICNKIDSLKMIASLNKAWRWSRLYGGAGVLLGVKDGSLSLEEPINFSNIISIDSLTVLSRYELNGYDIDSDINSNNFGLPFTYQLNNRFGASNTVSRIHHSRIIRFDGCELPRSAFVTNRYWGDSVLTRCLNPISNFNTVNDTIASAVQDFRVSVLKIDNLSDLMASGQEDLIRGRMNLLNLSKSVLNTMLISNEETYENMSTPLTGLSDVVKIIYDRLQAASDLPHTILFGEGADGATSGGSENRDFYDRVANQQEIMLTHPINRILDLILSSQTGPTAGQVPEGYSWNFKSLWQLSDDDAAKVRYTMAQTDQIYIQNNVLDAAECAASRFSPEGYSIETHIDFDERDDLDTVNKEPQGTKPMESIPAPAIASQVTSPQASLNGPQVASLLEIINQVTAGTLPSTSASIVIQTAFALSKELADSILADVVFGSNKAVLPPANAPTATGF